MKRFNKVLLQFRQERKVPRRITKEVTDNSAAVRIILVLPSMVLSRPQACADCARHGHRHAHSLYNKNNSMTEPVSASCIQCTPNPFCVFLKHACKSPDRRANAATEPAS